MKVPAIVTLSCVSLVFMPHETRPCDDGFVVQNHVLPASGGVALQWAVRGACQRLEQPACRGLLSEYSDASGRTLQENLEALGETGGTYLARILFGRRQRAAVLPRRRRARVHDTRKQRAICVRPRVQGPGRPRPSESQAIVIHEALHTLGLGKNPPSSAEITARVLERCRS